LNFETNNLAVLYKQKKFKEALQLANNIIKTQPENHQVYNILGLIYLAQNFSDQACLHFKKAISLSSGIPDYQHNLAQAYCASNKVKTAKKLLIKIIKHNNQYIIAHNTLGSIYFDEKKYDQAIKSFKQAIKINENYIDAIFNLANTYKSMNKFSSAVKYYRQIYSRNNEDSEVKVTLVNLYLKLGDVEQALEVAQNDASCIYIIAVHTEGKSNLEKALQYIEECLRLDGASLQYKRLKATILRRMGNTSKALKILQETNYNADTDIQIKIFVEFELGKLHDKNKNYDEAFKHYNLANELNNQLNPIESVAASNFISHVDRVYENLSEEWLASWKADFSADLNRQPVFMVAFPRSGTTLLDQVLDGHSEFVVMEELPIIGDVIKEAIRITNKEYPDLLSSINNNTLKKLRNYYFKRVDEQFKYDKSKTLVDKLPLNIVELELIHLLFPQSRVILSMRHPYDVCLSNYMQHYAANEAMMNFNTLDGVSSTYDKVMRLWGKYLSLFPDLHTHVVHYEKLVDDMESEIKALTRFLEVDWQPEILNFHQHALSRKALNTPSYQQVTQPVYTSSRYRWKNYEKHIIDPFKILNRYVEEFGYEI